MPHYGFIVYIFFVFSLLYFVVNFVYASYELCEVMMFDDVSNSNTLNTYIAKSKRVKEKCIVINVNYARETIYLLMPYTNAVCYWYC